MLGMRKNDCDQRGSEEGITVQEEHARAVTSAETVLMTDGLYCLLYSPVLLTLYRKHLWHFLNFKLMFVSPC